MCYAVSLAVSGEINPEIRLQRQQPLRNEASVSTVSILLSICKSSHTKTAVAFVICQFANYANIIHDLVRGRRKSVAVQIA